MITTYNSEAQKVPIWTAFNWNSDKNWNMRKKHLQNTHIRMYECSIFKQFDQLKAIFRRKWHKILKK